MYEVRIILDCNLLTFSASSSETLNFGRRKSATS